MKGLIRTDHARTPDATVAPGAPHVLVVDDDEDSLEFIRLQLKAEGYSVATAEDAVEAGHRMVERMPDLVIADFKMPYMDGVDFIKAVRSDPTLPDIPVIFITSMENSRELWGHTFGFPLLMKPLIVNVLVATVQQELALYKARRRG